jgi:hypothetical protein
MGKDDVVQEEVWRKTGENPLSFCPPQWSKVKLANHTKACMSQHDL